MNNVQPTQPNQPNQPRLLDQARTTIRLRGMSYRTEQSYADWIKRFIIFHNKRHPKEMGAREIRDFLAHLVNDRNVAPSTQNISGDVTGSFDRSSFRMNAEEAGVTASASEEEI